MQILVMLPHHHHDGSEAPCINPMHCVAELTGEGSEGGCCGGQGHVPYCGDGAADADHRHDGADEDCAMGILEVFHQDREKGDELMARILAANDAGIPSFIPARVADGETGLRTGSVRPERLRQLPARPHTEYIATAIPPRAPSFTV